MTSCLCSLQDLRPTESHSEDSGLSETESEPELQELMPSGRNLASNIQSLRQIRLPSIGESCTEGEPAAHTAEAQATILILARKSSIADGAESCWSLAPGHSGEKLPNSLQRLQMASVPRQLASENRSEQPGALRYSSPSVILCHPNESRIYRGLGGGGAKVSRGLGGMESSV